MSRRGAERSVELLFTIVILMIVLAVAIWVVRKAEALSVEIKEVNFEASEFKNRICIYAEYLYGTWNGTEHTTPYEYMVEELKKTLNNTVLKVGPEDIDLYTRIECQIPNLIIEKDGSFYYYKRGKINIILRVNRTRGGYIVKDVIIVPAQNP